MQRLLGWAGLSLLIFLTAGFLFASDTARWWAEMLWLIWIGGAAAAVAGKRDDLSHRTGAG